MTTKINSANIQNTGVTAGSYNYSSISVNTSGQISSASTGVIPDPLPKITSIIITDTSYNTTSSTAINITGGNIKIIGSNFVSGCTVSIGAIPASSTIFISSTELRAVVPAMLEGNYTVFVTNPNNDVGAKAAGLHISPLPIWVTNSTLPFKYALAVVNIQLEATNGIEYALLAGNSLPPGLSLSSSGLISGTISDTVTSETTFSFTIRVTDAELQISDQTFSWLIKPFDETESTYLLIAGGGGGGVGATWGGNGGGGAGGYLTGTMMLAADGRTYSVTIGAGGANATKGNDSIFSTLTAIGGGSGLPVAQGSTASGGSGGGGNLGGGGGGAGTVGPPIQGYNGGSGGGWCAGFYGAAGGGGGAGGVGFNGNCSATGAGGPGIANPITESNIGELSNSIRYIGGGGGGAGAAGGLGGGGAGSPAAPGAANTGGGGNGSGPQVGGSGVLVLKISKPYILNFSAGLTSTLVTSATHNIYEVTQGTGTFTLTNPSG